MGGSALSAGPTRGALGRRWRRSLLLFITGLLVVCAGGVAGKAGVEAGFWVGIVGSWVAVLEVLTAINAARMRCYLGRNPWRVWSCRFYEVPSGATPNGSPTLVLIDRASGEHFVLSIVSTNWRWRKLNTCDGRGVWFAGDPARGGVASPPGGSFLLMTRRLMSRSTRESRRRRTLEPPVHPERSPGTRQTALNHRAEGPSGAGKPTVARRGAAR